MIAYPIPVIGFCAHSGTGKTTLLSQVLPLLRAKGFRFGIIKHAHDQFEIDHPQKDSNTLRLAGAEKLLICSKHRQAIIEEREDAVREPTLDDALGSLNPEHLDLVLVEGFKNAHFPKIELHRKELGRPVRFMSDPDIVAIVSNASAQELQLDQCARRVALFALDQAEQISAFIAGYIQNRGPSVATDSPSRSSGQAGSGHESLTETVSFRRDH